MVSQAASRRNVTIVVRDEDLAVGWRGCTTPGRRPCQHGGSRGHAMSAVRVLIIGYGRMGKLVAVAGAESGWRWPAGRHRQRRTGREMARGRCGDRFFRRRCRTGQREAARCPRRQRRDWDDRMEEQEQEVRRIVRRRRHRRGRCAQLRPRCEPVRGARERAAELSGRQPAFGAWIHEAHHAAKRDAPSGTALSNPRRDARSRLRSPIDVSSTRAGIDSRHPHDRIRRDG